MADARCSGHDIAAEIGREDRVAAPVEHLGEPLQPPNRVATASTPWLIMSVRSSARRALRNCACSMSSERVGKHVELPSGRSTPRTTCATRLRDGRVSTIFRTIDDAAGAQRGRREPTTAAWRRCRSPARSRRTEARCFQAAAGADAHALNAIVLMSRDAPPAVASASRKIEAVAKLGDRRPAAGDDGRAQPDATAIAPAGLRRDGCARGTAAGTTSRPEDVQVARVQVVLVEEAGAGFTGCLPPIFESRDAVIVERDGASPRLDPRRTRSCHTARR